MLFRLTFLLVAGLFIAMYFAPNRPAPAPRDVTKDQPGSNEAAGQPGSASPLAAEPAPQPPQADSSGTPAQVTVARPAAPVPEEPTGPAAADLTGSAAETEATANEPTGAGDSPFAATSGSEPAGAGAADLIGLGLGGLGAGQTSDALSLSERVRNRTEAATSPAAAPAPQQRGLLAPTGPVTASPVGPVTGQRGLVVATSVNLRAGPSTGAAVVGRVDFGDTVVVVTQNAAPGWTGIRDPATGQVAFISSQFIQVQP